MNTEADIAVIGSGVAGLSAAATAVEGGAKVIVFEKQRALGGTSNFFGGLFAVESEMQRERYITYSRDEAFKNIMEYSHWRANPRLIRAFVDQSAETISWLQQQGVKFHETGINMPNAPHTYHPVKDRGEAVIKALATTAKEKGAIIKLVTPVKKLIRDHERITGVIAEEEDREITVTAKAVVIASGGYANNKDMIKKYSGFDLDVNLFSMGNTGKTGDGILMAWEAGAAEEGIGVLELLRAGPVGPGFEPRNSIEMVAAQPDLWVNPQGERFCDESTAFYDSSSGNANARYKKDGYTFSIFDDSIKHRLLERGIERQLGWENMPGTVPADIDNIIDASQEQGSTDIFVADSVEELAAKMGCDPAVFKATVDEYNYFCEKNHDDIFAKDPKYLWPLKEPKFYAAKIRTVFLGTLGGIKINHRAEVLDKKEKVIPGLYAAGFDAGGAYGDSYCINIASGMSAGFAINSGRIAGKNALKYIGK
jgi:fumarate reductase flavoprotein subunit